MSPTHQYTCAMHPELVKDEPGDCELCGMHLELVSGDTRQQRSTDVSHADKTSQKPALAKAGQYICAMHPEIVKDEPGDCPLCGMQLEPVIPTDDDDSGRKEYRKMLLRFLVSRFQTTSNLGLNWRWRHPLCFGQPGRSLCARFNLFKTAVPTCGP